MIAGHPNEWRDRKLARTRAVRETVHGRRKEGMNGDGDRLCICHFVLKWEGIMDELVNLGSVIYGHSRRTVVMCLRVFLSKMIPLIKPLACCGR